MFIKSLMETKNETSDLRNPSDWLVKMFGTQSSSGENVTVDSALTVPTVYACINVLANSVAKLPFQTFRKVEDGRERIKKHAVAKLIENRPNPYQSPFKFKHLIETHRNAWGNAYINVDWGLDGRPKSLWLLNPSVTEPVVDVTRNEIWYYTTLPDGTATRLEFDDVVHLTGMSTDGIKGFLKIDQMLNKEAKDKVRDEWEKANTGLSNAQRIAVLDAGLDFQSVSMPLKDAQFIEGMKYDKTEIATMFNVPLHMVNELERATHSNIEQQAIDFIQNTLSPILRQYEEEFTYGLFSEVEQRKYYLKFNLESLLRADKKTQAEFYRTMLDIGVYSINEVRDLEEKDAINNGDKHRVDLNHVSLDIADEYQRSKSGLKGGEEE